MALRIYIQVLDIFNRIVNFASPALTPIRRMLVGARPVLSRICQAHTTTMIIGDEGERALLMAGATLDFEIRTLCLAARERDLHMEGRAMIDFETSYLMKPLVQITLLIRKTTSLNLCIHLQDKFDEFVREVLWLVLL